MSSHIPTCSSSLVCSYRSSQPPGYPLKSPKHRQLVRPERHYLYKKKIVVGFNPIVTLRLLTLLQLMGTLVCPNLGRKSVRASG